MAWNSRRILIEVIDGTSDDALEAASRLGSKLKHKSDDPRWQAWVGAATVECIGMAVDGIAAKAVQS
jgi:hypothetical protein